MNVREKRDKKNGVQGETVGSVRSKLQERLGLPDKEWDKYRIATVLQGKAYYVEEQEDKLINLKVRNFIQGSAKSINLTLIISVGTAGQGCGSGPFFGRIRIQQIRILKTGSGSYWHSPRMLFFFT